MAQGVGAGDAPALVMRGVAKRFGSTVALAGVDFSVAEGEVHALVGENGAGKSTLMKILSGATAPDSGEVFVGGQPYAPASPRDARDSGVSMIYQELNLAPHLSVEANVFLGMEDRRWGLVRRGAHESRVREALALLGHPEIHPRTLVENLSPAARQVVEIARAIVSAARLIVLDEPTSSLGIDDAERLFAVIARLRGQGASVIYISHFLEEVYRVADRFTVLRNGETAGSGRIADVTQSRILELMVGRPLEELFPRVAHQTGELLLRVEKLAGLSLPREATLEVHRGEILGIAGLVGSGRTELLRAIYGLDPVRSGRIVVTGAPARGNLAIEPARPWRRCQQGLGLVSENRKEEGLALEMSVAENVTLSGLGAVARAGWIDRRRERREVERWTAELGVRSRGVSQAVRELSGGNQQKLAIARLLHQRADVFLLDEPTRGIDVGSKVAVYRLMGELAAQGKGVVFVSSYFPELIGVSDRISVMHRGQLSRARPASEWTERELLKLATTREDAA